jgi:hypothetical protein
MGQPKLELRFTEYGDYGAYYDVEVLLDGELLTHGRYGGEPEDQTRCRDYAWVETALTRLAEKLGATVEITEKREAE